MQSRLKYLKEHTIRLGGDEEGEGGEGEGGDTALDLPPHTPGSFLGDDDSGVLTLEPPPPPQPKEMLQPIDYTPFLRYAPWGRHCHVILIAIAKHFIWVILFAKHFVWIVFFRTALYPTFAKHFRMILSLFSQNNFCGILFSKHLI